MDYKLHYNKLMERAKERKLDCYTESHHIIPRCMNGSDDKVNLVDLTPREHFVAHILLVKIYPKEYGLIKAVNMMTIDNYSGKRIHNRMYGWLKEKFSKAQSISQSGERNSQYGKKWVFDIKNNKAIKINVCELDKYLSLNFNEGKKLQRCRCGTIIKKKQNSQYCSQECKSKSMSENNHFKGKKHSKESINKIKNKIKGKQSGERNSQYGTIWINNGLINKKIKNKEEIPPNFTKGKIKHGSASRIE